MSLAHRASTPAEYDRRRYVLTCPSHPEFQHEVVGAFLAALALRQHGCLDAYANPARLRQVRQR